MNPPPEIRFTLNRLDLLDWTWRYVLRSRLLLAMSILSSALIAWASQRGGRPPAYLVTSALLSFIGEWAGFLVLIPLLTLVRRHSVFPCEAIIRADDAGFHATSARAQSTVAWGTFERLRDGHRRLFLCLASDQCVVIPHRAFATDADRRAFESYCSDNIVRAKQANRRALGAAV